MLTGSQANGLDENSLGEPLDANSSLDTPLISTERRSESTAEHSRSAPRGAAAWLHADLSDTIGMPRRSGGMLASRPPAEFPGSPPIQLHQSRAASAPRHSMSEMHRSIVGFEAPSGSTQPPKPQSGPGHERPPSGRATNRSSVLTAVAAHLHRMDPSRPKPEASTPEAYTSAATATGASGELPATPQHATSTLLDHHDAASQCSTQDPTGYGSVVQQVKDRLDIDAHSLPFPAPPSIDPGTLHHAAIHSPLPSGGTNASSPSDSSPSHRRGRGSSPPLTPQARPDAARPASGGLASARAAAAPLSHRASSFGVPVLDEPKAAGAAWLQRSHPAITVQEEATPPGSLANDISVGLVNTIIALPVTVAFASVMYSHPTFAGVLPQLSRLLVFTNSLHQLVVTLVSRLPFAVGQVQDLGLIFLNAMTSDIAERLREEPQEVIVGTAILACALSTVLLGLALVLFGRYRLAAVTAYIPLPVVAGYLGYVGYFCLTAGFAQASALPIHSPTSWLLLLTHREAWLKLAATSGAVAAVFYSINVWRTPIALPATLVAIPVLWYAACGMLCAWWDTPWADVTAELADRGWVMPTPEDNHVAFWEVFRMFNLVPFSWGSIGWLALARQAPKLLALVVVCAFGTSMDIMAVQAEADAEVDTDWEVQTIGWANVLAGAAGGGGTGSYIFSQCLLAMRSGVRSRAQGATLSAAQLLVFLVPVALVQLLPNFYYGSLLIVIGADIMHEWLLATRRRIKRAEFLLSWLAFLSTVALTAILPVKGLEAGMLVGIVACSLHFAYEYSVMQLVEFSVVPSRSHVMLPYRHQQVLGLFQPNLVAVSVSGYLFFGSMVEITRRLREIAADLSAPAPLADRLRAVGLAALEPHAEAAAASAAAAARRFLLLDLRHVTGIDATTASAFASLRRSLDSRGVLMVLTGLAGHEGVQRMLVANGVVAADGFWESGRGCPAFESMDGAMVWCEEHFKQIATLCGLLDDLASQALGLPDVLAMHLAPPMLDALAPGPRALADTCGRLDGYMTRVRYKRGVVLFEHGDASDTMFIILSGAVASVFDLLRFAETDAFPAAWNPSGDPAHLDQARVPRLDSMHMHSLVPASGSHSMNARRLTSLSSAAEAPRGGAYCDVPAGRGGGKVRIVQAGPGALLGALDYTLGRRRSFQCLVTADATVLLLTRAAHERMARHDPAATAALQQVMLRSALTTTAHAMAIFERAAHT
eukprot:jgi/Ulvmu1/11214/UM072_0051.1